MGKSVKWLQAFSVKIYIRNVLKAAAAIVVDVGSVSDGVGVSDSVVIGISVGDDVGVVANSCFDK